MVKIESNVIKTNEAGFVEIKGSVILFNETAIRNFRVLQQVKTNRKQL